MLHKTERNLTRLYFRWVETENPGAWGFFPELLLTCPNLGLIRMFQRSLQNIFIISQMHSVSTQSTPFKFWVPRYPREIQCQGSIHFTWIVKMSISGLYWELFKSSPLIQEVFYASFKLNSIPEPNSKGWDSTENPGAWLHSVGSVLGWGYGVHVSGTKPFFFLLIQHPFSHLPSHLLIWLK